MMDGGKAVQKYQFAATLRDGVVEWHLGLSLDSGERVVVPIRDGEEVPILMQLCRSDLSVYYDVSTRTLRSGWNTPGQANS